MCGVTLLVRIIYGEKGLISHNLTLTKFTMAPRHKYRCNFCGKGDIPTMGGLKVHISLTQACREAMDQQMERSASPELMVSQSSVPDILQPGFVDSEPTNSGLTGDVDFPPFIPSPRRGCSAEPESVKSERQSKRARVEEVEDEEHIPDMLRISLPLRSYLEWVRLCLRQSAKISRTRVRVLGLRSQIKRTGSWLD